MNENLIFIREEKGLKQSDVAKYLNISQPNYSRWETGDLLVPLKQLNSLANFYSTSLDYLIGFTRKSTPTSKLENIDVALVAKNLKEIREENHLSIRGLAKMLNTTHSTLIAYEQGKNLIIISFAYDICKKFSISLDWLIGRSKIKYRKK